MGKKNTYALFKGSLLFPLKFDLPGMGEYEKAATRLLPRLCFVF